MSNARVHGSPFSGSLDRKVVSLARMIGEKAPEPTYTDYEQAWAKVYDICKKNGVPSGMMEAVADKLTKWLTDGNWPK